MRQLPSLTQAGFKGLCLQDSTVPRSGYVAVILPVLALCWSTAPLFSAFISIGLEIWGAHSITFTCRAQFCLVLRLGCRFHAAAATVPFWFRGVQLLLRFCCTGLVTRYGLLWT